MFAFFWLRLRVASDSHHKHTCMVYSSMTMCLHHIQGLEDCHYMHRCLMGGEGQSVAIAMSIDVQLGSLP